MEPPEQGWSVALSADGNTAIVGGYGDNSYVGAAWVFTRSGGVWTQQGSKLVGTGAVGDTADARSLRRAVRRRQHRHRGRRLTTTRTVGAAWVFTRSGGVWTQQGAQAGRHRRGREPPIKASSVALSGDGNTAIVGGHADNVFDAGRPGSSCRASDRPHDFNGDHVSDILWHHSNGSMSTWQMAANGTHTAFSFGVVDTAWQIAGTTSLVASTGDVDGGGKSDIFWRHTNGSLSLWEMNGGTSHTPVNLGSGRHRLADRRRWRL